LEIVNQVLERNPDHVAGLRMLVRIHWWQRDMDALRSSLERLAESAEASELIDEERYALTQLVRLAPDEQRYMDRLNLLGGLQDEAADDLSTMPEPAGEVPEFETFAVVQDQDEIVEPAAPVFEEFETFQTSEVQTSEVQTSEFETNETPGSTPAEFSDPTASFADLNEDFAAESVF